MRLMRGCFGMGSLFLIALKDKRTAQLSPKAIENGECPDRDKILVEKTKPGRTGCPDIGTKC